MPLVGSVDASSIRTVGSVILRTYVVLVYKYFGTAQARFSRWGIRWENSLVIALPTSENKKSCRTNTLPSSWWPDILHSLGPTPSSLLLRSPGVLAKGVQCSLLRG